MSIVKQAIVLDQNILSSANAVTASVAGGQNLVNFLVEVVIQSEEEKSEYSEEEKLTQRVIEADDDLTSPEVNIYSGSIQVISKKLDPKRTLLKISFDGKGKVPGSPGF